MAICSHCKKKYDPEEAAELFAADPYIDDNGLGYTYPSLGNLCSDCAIDVVMASYPQGLEDMSYHIGDD